MKNAGMAGAVALVGIGLISIALSNVVTAPQAVAAPSAVVNGGPEEPQIVWYGVMQVTDMTLPCSCSGPGISNQTAWHFLYRAWSDGTVERRSIQSTSDNAACGTPTGCMSEWQVVASPTEGMNAAADINFDGDVDGADLGLVLGYWGDAPRSPIPASDCPLGLMQ
jgi:hypothetical protein